MIEAHHLTADHIHTIRNAAPCVETELSIRETVVRESECLPSPVVRLKFSPRTHLDRATRSD